MTLTQHRFGSLYSELRTYNSLLIVIKIGNIFEFFFPLTYRAINVFIVYVTENGIYVRVYIQFSINKKIISKCSRKLKEKAIKTTD